MLTYKVSSVVKFLKFSEHVCVTQHFWQYLLLKGLTNKYGPLKKTCLCGSFTSAYNYGWFNRYQKRWHQLGSYLLLLFIIHLFEMPPLLYLHQATSDSIYFLPHSSHAACYVNKGHQMIWATHCKSKLPEPIGVAYVHGPWFRCPIHQWEALLRRQGQKP